MTFLVLVAYSKLFSSSAMFFLEVIDLLWWKKHEVNAQIGSLCTIQQDKHNCFDYTYYTASIKKLMKIRPPWYLDKYLN